MRYQLSPHFWKIKILAALMIFLMMHVSVCLAGCPMSIFKAYHLPKSFYSLGPDCWGSAVSQLFRLAKEIAEEVAPATTPIAVSTCLGPHPLLQKLTVGHLPGIRNLGLDLSLLGVETEKSREGTDHVGHPQTRAHDIWRVVLDFAVAHPALSLTDTGLDELPDEGFYDFAGWAVRGCPHRQERRPG